MIPSKYPKDIKQLTKDFAVKIIKYCLHLKSIGVEYSIRDQILRSGTSIGANIAESVASSSRKEYIRFHEISLRSTHETIYWLDLIKIVYDKDIQEPEFSEQLLEIKRITTSIILELKAKEAAELKAKEAAVSKAKAAASGK